jgi:hypothetical protein
MAKSEIYFEDNTLKVIDNTENAIEAVLLECAAEIASQTARNTRVDTGQLKSSWASNVDKTSTGYEATIGSPLENAIWEEFGTGEHALKGNGRKGGWFYEDEEGKGHFTHGKKPSRAFWNAFTSLKNKIINHIQNSLKGL